ncbi:BON domain-containing protein [Burkholderia oklahomensis]|uniref:BON domain-containing protein n=1 Tax=Burkholderia oklahomensis TaxID=342113 RepID=UPI0002F56DEE|nr:BON domain-containing protein [Burkholderia oklahomensis]AJX36246.1 BON domain protein [Burkholderia oklahomensis C6786]AOI50328.1 phospholipid-binding domain-containing protein [Burkholderia oklahomensis C6786]KUY53202.1 phospholipid-binding domain-containing protein [Burkholderia oklahomensis C6786]MBI0364142.1 BON domain-containing protein [Burkholderia oklahomensis]SUY28501.1 Osmotically-inducible protein Y precursor [Burkholderia oklahomensis]
MKGTQSRASLHTHLHSPRHRAKRFGGFGVAVLIAIAAACLALPQAAAAAGGDANGPNDMTGSNAANRAYDTTGASSPHSTSAGTKLRDTAVTAKVKATLLATNDLSSGGIHVTTRHGTVQLAGTVPDERQRTLAVDVTKQVEGVKTVRDKLSVRPK